MAELPEAARMNPLRCPSVLDGNRCQLSRLPHARHLHKVGGVTHSWGRHATRGETYEVDAPWITWTFLSSDRETRVTGRGRIRLICCVCGGRETLRYRIPRWGPIPQIGEHPVRKDAKRRHAHPDRGHPMSWVLPLRNLSALVGGVDLDLFAARLEADINHPIDNGDAA